MTKRSIVGLLAIGSMVAFTLPFAAQAATLQLTVAGVTASNKVYDRTTSATINTSSATLVGVQSGDHVSLNTSGATGTFSDKNVGNGKLVTIAGLSLKINGNPANTYTLIQPTTTASIAPATVTVGNIHVNDRTYNGTTTEAIVGTSSLSGVISGDSVTLITSGANASFATKTVGQNKPVTVSGYTISGADAGNYTLTQPSGLTADITAAPLTVTASGTDKVYDRTTTATVTLSDNRIAGDVLTVTSTSATFNNKNVGTGKPVSVTGISITGTDAGNYTLSNTTAVTTASITARSLAVSATGVNKTYDGGTAATVNFTTTAISGDSVTASGTATFGDKNVGTGKPVSVTGISITGTDAGNYTLSNTTASTSANISAKALTLTISGVDKTYDGTANASVTLSLSGTVTGDNVTASFGTATFANKNAGNHKTVTVTGITLGGTDAGNYSLSTTSGTTTANINKLAITVTALTNTKLYDASASAAAVPALSGALASGDSASFIETYDNANVGTGKTLTPSGAVSDGNGGANYTITFVNDTTGVITAHALTVTGITAANKVYDGTTAATINAGGATLSGLVSGDHVNLHANSVSGTFGDANVGNGKTVTITGFTVNGPDASNYTLSTTATTAANITAAPLTVTANNATKTFGESDPALTFALTSGTLFGSDTITGAPARDAGEGVGSYTINQGSVSAGSNYTLTFVPGTFTITAATGSVTLSHTEQTYDGTPKEVSATTDPEGLSVALTYDGTTTAPTNAGSYDVIATITQAGFLGSASGTLTIQKADQTITFGTLEDKTVDDSAFTVTATSDSNLDVSFTASGSCTVSDSGLVELTGAGTCSITAHQEGDSNYNPAADVVQSFTVSPTTATLTIVKNTIGGDGTFTFGIAFADHNSTDIERSITTDGGSATSSPITIPAGTSTVAEFVPDGWTLTNSHCEYDGVGVGDVLPSGGEQIFPAAGADVTCTFTNTKNSSLFPDLTVTKSHDGSFTQGENGATYTITVSNVNATSTNSTTTVTDALPEGLTLVSMSGNGWTCDTESATCTRNDALAGGESYPAITVTVNVSQTAPEAITNTATVAGGGETNTTNDSATDKTTILTGPVVTLSPESGTEFVGQVGIPFSQTFTASDEPGDTFVLSESGTLPSGLSFEPGTGTLSGTPTTATGEEPLSFNITANSSGSAITATGSGHYTITINPAPPVPTGTLNVSLVVNNQDGGSASPSDFVIDILGTPSSTFNGSASGTAATINANTPYNVSVEPVANYAFFTSGDCHSASGVLENTVSNCAITALFTPEFSVTTGGGGAVNGNTGIVLGTSTVNPNANIVIGGSSSSTSSTTPLPPATPDELARELSQQLKGANCVATFNKDLHRGMTDADVLRLQKLLNASTLTQLAASGAGSPGNETSYFGLSTRIGVISFQEIFAKDVLAPAHMTHGNGFVGPLTRAKLNSFCSAH